MKVFLGISAADTSADAWLDAELLSASDRVTAACGIEGDGAGDAHPTFIAETATVIYDADEIPADGPLILPWRLPARVTAVTVASVALATSEFRSEPKAALLHRLGGVSGSGWTASAVVVTLTSGWDVESVPPVLASAVKRLVREQWDLRGRNTLLKARSTDGVGRDEFWIGTTTSDVLPADMLETLQAAGFVNPSGIG